MFTLYRPGITLASLRRQFEEIKRKYARIIAAAVIKPVADHIVELWNIAVAAKLPVPDPVNCVRIVADAGFRPKTPKTWIALHEYIDHCERYRLLPDADEIIEKLLPPKQRVQLHVVLLDRFRSSESGTLWA